MTLLPSLEPIVADVKNRFGNRLQGVTISQSNEVCFRAAMDLVAGFSAHLYKRWNARLVTLFADDASPEPLHVYYVFALDAAHGFFILRVPISREKPELVSLTNAIPAVNWQEREVQDMFGIKLLGHPNPRRCTLHDDWPDVHPLRKDFPTKGY